MAKDKDFQERDRGHEEASQTPAAKGQRARGEEQRPLNEEPSSPERKDFREEQAPRQPRGSEERED